MDSLSDSMDAAGRAFFSGMEVEWNCGTTTPIERSVPDDFYPMSDNGVT